MPIVTLNGKVMCLKDWRGASFNLVVLGAVGLIVGTGVAASLLASRREAVAAKGS